MASSSETPCEHIPRHIIEKSILPRLPVKSLLRNRCVLKSWNVLISDPRFAREHLSLSPKIIQILFRRAGEFLFYNFSLDSVFSDATAIATTPLGYPTDEVPIEKFVGSCDGILCFSTSFIDLPDTLLLWNPSIGKSKVILCFEDQESDARPIYGFGRDYVSDTYKLVALYPQSGDEFDKTRVRVQTLGTGSWRRIQDFPPRVFSDHGSSHFLNGRLHWIAADFASTVIVSLDLGNESFQEILLPDGKRGPLFHHVCLAVLRDCMCLLECCEYAVNCLCLSQRGMRCGDLWIMKEYGNVESWTKLCCIQFHEATTRYYMYVRPLYISEDDQVIMTLSSMVFVYNCRNVTFKHIKIGDCSIAYPYVESLISPSWY